MDALFEMLSTLVGFSVVMLLLSLMVMALVQLTQHVLNLRARNLLGGLSSVLSAAGKSIDTKKGSVLASRILQVPAVLLEGEGSKTKNGAPKVKLSAVRTWIEKEDLVGSLREIASEHGLDNDLIENAKKRFAEAEGFLRNRFAVWLRYVSVVWALVIAFVFQVSAPDLLRELSMDPELRGQLVSVALAKVADGEGSTDGDAEAIKSIPQEALARLAEQKSDLGNAVTGLSLPENSTEAIAALKKALGDRSDAPEILASYEELLGTVAQERVDASLELVGSQAAELGQIQITPWSKGWDFYTSDVRRLLGVLMTGVLLTLGAPFWFKTLQELVGLRDLFAPGKKKGDGGGE